MSEEGSQDPVEKLQQLGYGEYEARAWLQLLELNPASAYEVSKGSGIPSSKIYAVLDKLVERGASVRDESQGKTVYAPLSIKDFLSLERHRAGSRIDALEKSLENRASNNGLSWLWNISRIEDLYAKVSGIIENCTRELIISAWGSEFARFESMTCALETRGAKVAAIIFGGGNFGLSNLYYHPIEDTLQAERGGRTLSVVADQNIALTATIDVRGNVSGAWSQNPGFVMLAEDYIKHDIYLMKIVQRMDQELTETFGERYRLLRDVFSNKHTKN